MCVGGWGVLQIDLSTCDVFSDSFNLKYSICKGAIIWDSVSPLEATFEKYKFRQKKKLDLAIFTKVSL